MGSRRSTSVSKTTNIDQRRFAYTADNSQTTETNSQQTTITEDNRDLSDNRQFDIVDSSVDKRAVLNDAQQILDSVYVNVDPSDEVLRSTIASWERQAEALLSARRTDNAAIQSLLSDVIDAANAGIIAVNDAQYAQLQSWQAQLQATLDFAQSALDTNARLLASTGERQQEALDTGARLIASAGDRQQDALDTGARLIASAGDRQQDALDTGARLISTVSGQQQEQLRTGAGLIDRASQRALDAFEVNARLINAASERSNDALDTGAQLIASTSAQQQEALDTGARLIASAGDRQAGVTADLLDLARGTLGQTSNVQVKLVGWVLVGAALIVAAGQLRRTLA